MPEAATLPRPVDEATRQTVTRVVDNATITSRVDAPAMPGELLSAAIRLANANPAALEGIIADLYVGQKVDQPWQPTLPEGHDPKLPYLAIRHPSEANQAH